MKRLKLLRLTAALALAVALSPRIASAQEADTFSISGTFRGFGGNVLSSFNGMEIEYPGMLGEDLAGVYANGHEHAWTLTLHGVTYSHDYVYQEWNDEWSYGCFEQYITRVHATSFDFEFVGPDADILNAVVSAQLTGTSLTDGAFLELWNGDWFDSSFPFDSGPLSSFDIGLRPLDPSAGVSFDVSGGGWVYPFFSTDGDGYPLVEPRRVGAYSSRITDLRPGNVGGLFSSDDLVDIGSSVPPVPPPPPLTLSIADESVQEGDRGTTPLNLAVTLSRSTTDTVTVKYATADGTAQKKSDYSATSGSLTFQPGQTSRTVSVAIKGDRKREPNETVTVQISNAVGATIADGVATVTILNDD
jgi:hypothetical protein